MPKSNLEILTTGLDSLLQGLRPYVQRELQARYRERWWSIAQGALPPSTAARENDFDRLDLQALLVLMWELWNELFRDSLGHAGRSYVSELREVRNRWAHQQTFTVDDTHRTLDTAARLLAMIAANEEGNAVRILARDLLRQQFEKETDQELKQASFKPPTGPLRGLKAWRQVATPHPDVASGRYQQTEFAADLALVASGKAEAEYQDPLEFFRRTYFTEGLSQLLSRAWERLASSGGDPVVELQTNFGGGKTHSMLALYHLFGGKIQAAQIPDIEKIIPAALKGGNTDLPQANCAVLVGTFHSPAEIRTKPDGIQVHTLWGELAWQLGGAAAYQQVAEEDRAGISPGSAKLGALFNQYGPVLVLIDEWVAYARQLYGKEGQPAGSFDANITFVQALTEATKAAPDALVVAALPASEIEVGGEGGKAALERISDVFSRLKAVWKPASADESFEIVRRRLFQPITDYSVRDAVCRAFAEMYQNNRAEFPPETREKAYEERMKASYPIHPELFDRLYEDWSTLERFQRTRGVLKLMAAVIHELWEQNDASPMILPGSVPLHNTSVRVGLTDHLGDGWSAVVDKDIDGSLSRPLGMDRANPNLGRFHACRRVARTVFIGSAPSVSAQKVRGIEEVRVKLGCVFPTESPAVFGDALRRLSEELHYLYSDANRYWFDTQITISRQAGDRAAQYERKPELVEDEITRRARELVKKERSEFSGVHAIPADSADVPDEAACRLVILGSKTPHRGRAGASSDSPALTAAQEILERRGNSPRLYRNMLVFLAADADRLAELQQATRLWLAWKSIEQEAVQLNLNAAQERQARKQVQTQEERIAALLLETYCHLIIPTQEGTAPTVLATNKLQGDGFVARVLRKLKNEEQFITQWSPANLRMELDRYLWKDTDKIGLKQLWEYMAQYPYLPRLRDQEVLAEAIRQGVGSLTWKDFFAYASARREDGYYIGLVAGAYPAVIFDGVSLLVKPEVAQSQREAESQTVPMPPAEQEAGLPASDLQPSTFQPSTFQPETKKITHFHASVELDPTRLGRDAGRIAEEVLSHLTGLVGAKAKITLEMDIEVPNGIPEEKIRIVSENANTLKFKGHEFGEG